MKKKTIYIIILCTILVGVLWMSREPQPEDPGIIIDSWPNDYYEEPIDDYRPEYKYSFEKFPVEVSRELKKAPLELESNPIGPQFVTRITEAYKGEVNFAGHYVLASWGCGMGCGSFVVIEGSTGKIYGLYTTAALADGMMATGIDFVLESNLIIIKLSVEDREEKIVYYQWENNELKQVVE